MADAPQTYKTHRVVVPMYHYVLFLILLVNFIWAVVQLWREPGAATSVSLLLAFGLIVLALFARVFALKVQDRVIRLEMRLRLRELLPSDLQGHIRDFTIDQLVALRFASDAELPGLAATVLRDGITNRDAIKKMIRDWQADELRA
jgi:hypothetical protein